MHIQLYGRGIALNAPSWETEARWTGRLSPEPETVAWIESMEPGSVLFDIGANVGRFSITAACRGLKVYAFEPQAQQYAELCRHVVTNGLSVTAFCVALGSGFAVGNITKGRSDATFTEGGGGKQGALSWPLDAITERLGIWPDHIKLDVDGNEPEIIKGGKETVGRAQTVLIEIDPGAPGHEAIVREMASMGFTFDPAQVESCREKGGRFPGMANHIFRKSA